MLVLAEGRDGALGLLIDGAGKAAKRVVGLQSEPGLAALADALLEQKIERELKQRQHVGPVDVADEPVVEPLAGLGVGLVDEARGDGRPADDLVDLGCPRRREIVGRALGLHRQQLRLLEEALVEIGAKRGDDPDAPRRHELREQLGKTRPLRLIDLARKQLVELIDHDQKIGPHRPIVATLLGFLLSDPVESPQMGLAQVSSA